jgi:hypothetical protein
MAKKVIIEHVRRLAHQSQQLVLYLTDGGTWCHATQEKGLRPYGEI